MRALWVTAIAPCFEGGGGEIRQAHLLSALARRHEVTLLVAGTLRDERIRHLLGAVHELPVSLAAEPRGRAVRRLRDIRWTVIDRDAEEVARHRGVRDALARAIERVPEADLVCVEYIGLAPILQPRRRNVWSLTLHNLPSEMARHKAVIAPGPRQRAMLELERRNARRIERWAADAYDVTIAASLEDAAALGGDVAVIPNGVDTTTFRPSAVPKDPRLIFTGALHTLPNSDGIRWFADDIWPRIRVRIPGVTLDVVGARPLEDVLALNALDGVHVHPDVPDVAPYLARARAAIVPLRIGSGSRLKVLEAMAAGRPVVSTAIGAGGLTAEPQRDLLVVDDAEAFAQAVVRCLADAELAARLGASGRALVETRYSWGPIGDAYVSLLERRIAAS
jgi:glycosyltransferase involved in cell wall biosynthesis